MGQGDCVRLNGRSRAGRVKGPARPLAPVYGPARAIPGASAPASPARLRQRPPARLGKRPPVRARRKASARQPKRGRRKAKGPPPGLANGPKEGARLLSAGAGMMREGYRARETFTSAPIAYPCGKRSSASHRAKRRETVTTCASASVFPARTIRTRQRCTFGIMRICSRNARRPLPPLAARDLRTLAPPGFPGGTPPLAQLLPRNSPA